MSKTRELLTRKIRRFLIPVLAVVVLAAITLVVCAATVGKIVHIYDGEIVTNVKTGQATVLEALEEAEIILGEFDKVEPERNAPIKAGMDIHITRAFPMSLTDGAESREIYSLAETVGDVLKEQKITLLGFDTVTPAPETPVFAGMSIVVQRSKTISLMMDGVVQPVSTLTNTVEEVLAAMEITLDENDFTEPELSTPLSEGLEVRLVRVEEKTVTEKETVGYTIEERNSSSLSKGSTRIVQAGRNGVRTKVYSVVLYDGEEASRTLVSSDITKQPVKKIVERGTAAPKKSAPSAVQSSGGTASTAKGENFAYRQKITCTATAYDLSYESCGKSPGHPGYGITASGMQAAYGVIAVDPSVIPLGTQLYVEAADGSWTYGYCVAGDTGSGIRGNRIDLFFPTRTESKNFGRRTATVYVL